ncbi:MAG: (4Fe-4S)-binding protein [Acidimicrobiia bacterium]
MTRRTYENAEIRVLWDSSVCIHTGLCLRGGQGAFDVERRPWVDLEATDTETIAAAIEACPSGALRYERLDGGPQEQPAVPTTIIPWPNGPLMVRGEVEVQDRHGDTFVSGPRAALCRCGDSSNQPFCDLSHREAGFRDFPRVEKAQRKAATDPSGISEHELD